MNIKHNIRDNNIQIFFRKMFFLLCLLSCLFYCFVPDFYSFDYILSLFAIFIFQICIYFKLKNKQSYWDFDTIFLLVFGISAFAYPLFIYNTSEPFLPFFNLSFRIDDISKAAGVSSIAASFYMLGSLSKKRIRKYEGNNKVIKTNVLVFLILFLACGFVLMGGVSYYQSMYDKTTSLDPPGIILQLLSE